MILSPGAAAAGPEVAAIRSLYDGMSNAAVNYNAGTLSVGTLAYQCSMSGRLTALDFTVGTAPTGGPLQLDLLVNGVSAIGPGGATIAAGQTEVTLTTFANPLLPDGCTIQVSVLAVGLSVAGANLTTTIIVGPF
jgi:hypothetical protein